MQIDWAHFTPVSALVGGLLIGTAAALFAVWNGRVAGISGILGGLLRPKAGDVGWRVAFLAGLIAAPVIYSLVTAVPTIQIAAGYPLLAAAGVLVGLGTRYGSGCTSGHGVCGLSRGSPRSVAATVVFIVAGFATVYVMRHLLGG